MTAALKATLGMKVQHTVWGVYCMCEIINNHLSNTDLTENRINISLFFVAYANITWEICFNDCNAIWFGWLQIACAILPRPNTPKACVIYWTWYYCRCTVVTAHESKQPRSLINLKTTRRLLLRFQKYDALFITQFATPRPCSLRNAKLNCYETELPWPTLTGNQSC